MSSIPNPRTPDENNMTAGEAPTPGASEMKPAADQAPRSPRTVQRVSELPQFRVMLHDDEATEMTFVVRSIVELTPLSAPLARDVMLSAHEHGVAQMLVTHRERAELYQEQFAGKGLTVTIEPAG